MKGATSPTLSTVEAVMPVGDRPDRRFPFEADSHVTIEAIDRARAVVVQWALPWVKRWARNGATVRGLDHHTSEDIASETITSLWAALPQYDRERGRLCTFLRTCARNRIRRLVKQAARQRQLNPITTEPGEQVETRERFVSHAVYQLAELIQASPADYLGPRDVALLNVVLIDMPAEQRVRVAGFTNPANYHRAVRRLRQRIRSIAEEQLLDA